jgi:U3 small nucleolar RNA-associated protein MPP10
MVEQSTKTEAETSSSNDLECLVDILTNPEKKILPLLYSTANVDDDENNNNNNNNADQEKQTTLEALLSISKSLFLDIESMGKQYQALHEKQKAAERGAEEAPTTTTSTMILSGLNELYIPPEVEATDTDLPETIFGQVDLQTVALAKLVKKSTKRLKASSTSDDAENDVICILDMGVMESGDEDNDDGSDSDENDGDSDSQNSAEEEETEEFSDEEAERIRRRMERAMDDMEDDDEEGSSEEEEETAKDTKKPETKEEEELYDPVAEDMKDGFFDLNEMEDFADEEEEFLPNEAFGKPSDEGKKKKNEASKKSFHQRQREGINNDSDDEDSDEDIDMYEEVREVKRKKYREQEDIDALYELYQETNPEDDDDDDDGDIVNMTAADFFGGPKKRYIERYKKNHTAGKTAPKKDDDEDSWGEYDFDKEDQEGWRDDNDDDDDDEEEEEGDEDEEIEDMKDPAMGEAEKEELEVPGRKTDDKKKLSKQEEKLRRETDELEKELINEKPWQMRGESKAMARPVNSLLEGTPEFEMASKQAPTITVEHTMNLEDVIKKRILAEDWDDVVPRELPDIGWNKKRGEAPEVSQEKSKLGLGELYEREYLKKAVGYDKDADEKQTEEDKAKDEMRQLFANLCSKLDALSNYHFAPRPIADEAEARAVTVPAIAMEEVLPLHVSDARGTAPEEVFATKRGREGILRADHEMDQQERKRQRQSKKAARRKARKEKEADEKLISRLQPGLGLNNPYEKRKAREELSEARAKGKVVQGEQDMDSKYGSSGTFFKRLQAEAQQTIQGQAAGDLADKQEKKAKARSSAYKL